MSFGEDQPMDIDADKQELQRNRKQESAWSVIPNISPGTVQALFLENVRIQMQAIEKFRKLLCNMPYPPIGQVIKSGAVPRFVHFLEDSRYPKRQFESAWVLTNIARGSSAGRQTVIESGAVPVLVGLLSSPTVDAYVWPYVCRTLSSLSDGSNEQIQVIINSGVLPRAIQLLSHSSTMVAKAALDFVGTIAMGNDSQAQVLINANALPALGCLLSHKMEPIVKKACWTLSNITAGNEQQIQAVMDANLIPSLLKLLHHRNAIIRIRAAWAIANATAKGSEEQILCIVEAGAIAPLCKLLSKADSPKYPIGLQKDSFRERYFSSSDLTHFALKSLENILRTGASFAKAAGSTVNPFATLICNSPSMKVALYSEDKAMQLDATKRFRNLLGTSEGLILLINEVIRSGTVPRFVSFLEDSRYPKLQYASAFVLTNIASGNSAQTHVVIESGAVPLLIRLLSSPNTIIVKQAFQALRNIAGDSTESRDLVLNSNVLPPLLGLFNDDNASLSLMRTATCTLRNLCWGQNPPPNLEQVSKCLPSLSRLINSQDDEILSEACMALSGLSEGPNEQIQVIINSGVCPRAVQLLNHTSTMVVKAALRLVRNITSGDDSQAQVIINANALPALGNLLSHEEESIVKGACLTLANITAGTTQQIQALIDANILPSLIELLQCGDIRVRKSAAWALANATPNGSEEQIGTIVDAGAIAPLCKLLSEADSDLIENVLCGLSNILRAGKGMANAVNSTENAYATLAKQCAGFEKIYLLSSHDDLKITQKASTIIKMYFA